jgi:hypothetical protein
MRPVPLHSRESGRRFLRVESIRAKVSDTGFGVLTAEAFNQLTGFQRKDRAMTEIGVREARFAGRYTQRRLVRGGFRPAHRRDGR